MNPGGSYRLMGMNQERFSEIHGHESSQVRRC